MNPHLKNIIEAKEADRRRLRALPWLEKLEMLNRLRERHLFLQRMKPRPARTPATTGAPKENGPPEVGHDW